MIEQVPFGAHSFAENPEPRCPCVLLLDVSGSMMGAPIAELNAGVVNFKDELIADSLASKRVEVAIVTFGGQVQTVCDFTSPEAFLPPTLAASADTPMGAAINQAMDLLEARKQVYRGNGIAFFRPWIILITDGAPTDEWQTAAARVREGEAGRAFAFFAIGVEGADLSLLSQISAARAPLKLRGLRFRDFFCWLSNSLKSVSRSKPGDEVQLANPLTPEGWATV